MITRQITTADIVNLTGYTRHQVRKLIESVPELNKRTKTERIASKFTTAELVTILILCELESVYGIRRGALSLLSNKILSIFVSPREYKKNTRLLIDFRRSKAKFISELDHIEDGIVLPLDTIFERIHEYLLGNLYYSGGIQKNLNLGLGAVKHDVNNSETLENSKQSLSKELTKCL